MTAIKPSQSCKKAWHKQINISSQ